MVGQTVNSEQSMKVKLSKGDREFLMELLTTSAGLSHPPCTRNVDWLDLTEVEGTTSDGGLVSFPLSHLSHLTTYHVDPEGEDDEQREKNREVQQACPRLRRAVVHLVSGDFYVMKANFAWWENRMSECRLQAYNKLGKVIQ
jgi:hypothetical protein